MCIIELIHKKSKVRLKPLKTSKEAMNLSIMLCCQNENHESIHMNNKLLGNQINKVFVTGGAGFIGSHLVEIYWIKLFCHLL